MRVISLVPSLTETLRSWGIEPIATTAFCQPVGSATVGGTKNPDLDRVAALRPDVVVMDTHENRIEDHRLLAEQGVNVVATDVDSLARLTTQLSIVADAVGAPVPLSEPRLPPAVSIDRRAFIPIWRRPWMTIGGATYGSTVLEHLGIANVFGRRDGYPEVDLVAVEAEQPDLVIVPSEPYRFRPHHLDELTAIAPVVEVDGQDLFWWGARTPAAIARLAVVLRKAAAPPESG